MPSEGGNGVGGDDQSDAVVADTAHGRILCVGSGCNGSTKLIELFPGSVDGSRAHVCAVATGWCGEELEEWEVGSRGYYFCSLGRRRGPARLFKKGIECKRRKLALLPVNSQSFALGET